MNKELLTRYIALSLVPNVGPVLARNLISYCGGIENVFSMRKPKLEKIPGIGSVIAKSIVQFKDFERAEKEWEFIEKKGIRILHFFDPDYPERLKRCYDAPLLLYYKGNTDLNAERIISIVGTRNISDYGRDVTEKLVEDLRTANLTIISGMAYGIDICAHKACLKNNIPTVGVFGHGLDKVYPSVHKDVADKMTKQGGLLAEYPSGSRPDRENFPARNRIVAGLADATIIVEAGEKGGALITAEIAGSYNRDVFAFPGRVNDTYSVGCNNLIKSNKAALITNASDMLWQMGWESQKEKKKAVQRSLFVELEGEEKILYEILKETGELSLDAICQKSNFTAGKVATHLLNMEFEGIVRSLPGKRYSLVN